MTKLIHTKYKTIQPHWDDKIDTYKVQNNTTSLRWQNWYIQSTKQYNLTKMRKLIHTKYKTIQPHWDDKIDTYKVQNNTTN